MFESAARIKSGCLERRYRRVGNMIGSGCLARAIMSQNRIVVSICAGDFEDLVGRSLWPRCRLRSINTSQYSFQTFWSCKSLLKCWKNSSSLSLTSPLSSRCHAPFGPDREMAKFTQSFGMLFFVSKSCIAWNGDMTHTPPISNNAALTFGFLGGSAIDFASCRCSSRLYPSRRCFL